MKVNTLVIITVLVWQLTTTSGQASTLPSSSPYVPAGLGVGDVFQLIFASSVTQFGANYGGLAGADAFVQAAADATGAIGGPITWKAVVSDSTTNAIDHVPITAAAGLFNTIGDQIANDQADLWDGSIDNPVSADENQFVPTTVLFSIWSGTTSAGVTDGLHCGDWTGAPGAGSAGLQINTTGSWINDFVGNCQSNPGTLYGISSEITVVVPEPSSAPVGVVGLLLLGLRRNKRILPKCFPG